MRRQPHRHRRRVSRRVRLRRTIAGATLLAVLTMVGVKLLTRDDAVAAVDALPGVAASATSAGSTSRPGAHGVPEDGPGGCYAVRAVAAACELRRATPT